MTESYADLERGVLLYEQRRYDLAAATLRRQLASTPDEPHAHTFLALSLHELERHDEALDAARSAVALDPALPLARFALGHALLAKHRRKAAMAEADELVRLEPSSAEGYILRAAVQLDAREWSAALASADEALRLQPNDEAAQTLRGLALTQLGRRDQAAETLGAVLRVNPENSYAHASRAFGLLNEGRHREALEGFLEALRLDPKNDSARAGLAEAMKARNPFYAAMLRYFLWAYRLGGRALAILIVGWLAVNWAVRVLDSSPSTAWIATIIMVVYPLFVWSTIVASPLFNLVLRLDPVGRHALTDEERTESTLLIPLLAVGVPALVYWLLTGSDGAFALGVAGIGGAIPLAVGFSARAGVARAVMFGVAVVVVALGCAALALDLLYPGAPLIGSLVLLAGGLCALSTWASWPIMLRS